MVTNPQKKQEMKAKKSEVAEAFHELNVYLNSYLRRLREANKSEAQVVKAE